ncbi:MAG: S1/P1 nuclease [Steroidobacteraceae bacterium]
MHHLRAPRLAAFAVAGLGFSGALPVRAWNDFGHMAVAAVAWQHLTPAARTEATKLLRMNPDYPRWVEQLEPDARAVTAFMRAATWADAIKHESGNTDDGERPQGPEASQNTGYDDPNEHRYWHYVDVPFSPDGTPVPGVITPNAATRIADFRKVLADPASPDLLKSYDLSWVLHLVGDIHQPLHAVSRFTRELPAGDLGGNRVLLCAPPCRKELHFFWDQALGRGTPTEALALARDLPAPPLRRITDTNIQDWVDESGTLARRVVYAAPIGPGSGPYELTPAYRDQAKIIARERIALAGRRLAVLLNAAFAPSASGFSRSRNIIVR